MEENAEIGEALHQQSFDALSVKHGVQMENTRYASIVEGGVALLRLYGPIYPRANMMTASGATSIAQYTKDFITAYNHPDVRTIIQVIDSPGGDVRGIGDAAQLIYDARQEGRKRILTFAEGYMASAAYYTGSSSEEIWASPKSSMIGSIGVVLTAMKNSKDHIEIVSSISPNKRPNAETEEGRAVLQEQVDDLAEIFATDVQTFRNITNEVFMANYGQGAVFIGPRAERNGLIDGLCTLGELVEMAASDTRPKKGTRKIRSEARMGVSAILKFSEEETSDMGLKDLKNFFAEKNEEETLEGSAAVIEDDAPAQTEQQEPQVTRAALEEQFTESAQAFVERQVLRSKIHSAEQLHYAGLYLTARVDDKLFGGTVEYVDAKGELKEGSRLDQLQAAIDARPAHTLTQKAIPGIKSGSIRAQVLTESEEDKETVAETEMSPERKKQLLASSAGGQAVLANQNGNGNGAK